MKFSKFRRKYARVLLLILALSWLLPSLLVCVAYAVAKMCPYDSGTSLLYLMGTLLVGTVLAPVALYQPRVIQLVDELKKDPTIESLLNVQQGIVQWIDEIRATHPEERYRRASAKARASTGREFRDAFRDAKRALTDLYIIDVLEDMNLAIEDFMYAVTDEQRIAALFRFINAFELLLALLD